MLCTECQRDLSEDAFPVYWDKCRQTHVRRKKCRDCYRAYQRLRYQMAKEGMDYSRCATYPADELRYRPAEQLVESMSARDMARALGWSKDTAARVKRDPSAYVDTPLEIDDVRVQQMRAWLENAA